MRTCSVLEAERSRDHYRRGRHSQVSLKRRITEIALTCVRCGYWRVHVLLRREGWEINAKRVYRLYMELGLQLQHKTPKRCIKAKQREGCRPVLETNETW